ncbi:uronate dehydrogenase [Rhodoligotrophos appendicifer]|uniref:NAD-dependent epimerase/dehydratase family protein n=1 Tax=Rhodoligotrophos appendicifer TaxID=987056 RepID=UPI001186E397|nr:NAD(P)-dependent oxidoreductase [Rhodoligotrophos appendicifer]
MRDSRPTLLTGAAGVLGRWLRPRLIEAYGSVRSSDVVDPAPALPGEETSVVDLADFDAVEGIVKGAGRIIHFGGISYETSFDRILSSNILGTYNVFEAARRHGAGPIVYASSNHAIGFYTRDDRLDVRVPKRPDSLYGVSKAFGEDLASLFFDKYGVESACLRIGTARPDPIDPRHLSTWHSYDDLLRLIEACFAAPHLGCTVLYGVSNNDRSWWSNEGAPHVDYRPQDNAEDFAATLIPDGDTRDMAAPEVKYQGGPFVSDGYVKR